MYQSNFSFLEFNQHRERQKFVYKGRILKSGSLEECGIKDGGYLNSLFY